MRLFGSQGQARCAALSLRLAEAEILGADGDDRGIILLDDCLSEIDAERQRLLLDLLAERGQIFLSCTQAPDRTLLMEGKEFLVEGGGMRERP
jgi:DNA replication and repair protein RecF